MSRCKACGAEILFIRSAGGNFIPCYAEQVTYWQTKGGLNELHQY